MQKNQAVIRYSHQNTMSGSCEIRNDSEELTAAISCLLCLNKTVQ